MKGPRSHLLVCAPSNAAVDEIMLRITRDGLWKIDGTSYKPSVVRLGNLNTIHPDLRSYSLDMLLEKGMKDPEGEFFQQKQQVEDKAKSIL